MEPTEVVSVMPKRGPSSPKIIVDTNLTVQNSSAIRPTPVKAGKSITHLDNNKQVQVSCLLLFLVLTHGLRTPSEEIAFTVQSKINSHFQIFRYGQSIFCLPHRPKFSNVFDLCLHWVSVVRVSANKQCHSWISCLSN